MTLLMHRPCIKEFPFNSPRLSWPMPTSANDKNQKPAGPKRSSHLATVPLVEVAVAALKADLLAKCTDLSVAAIKAVPANWGKTPVLRLEFPDFLAALQGVTPKAVFWFESVFEPEAFVRLEMEEAGWSEEDDLDDEAEREFPTAKEVLELLEGDLAKLRMYDGTPYFLMAVYSQDGVPRTFSQEAPWASDLEARVAAIMEDSEEAAAEQPRVADAEAQAMLARLVKEIAGRRCVSRYPRTS